MAEWPGPREGGFLRRREAKATLFSEQRRARLGRYRHPQSNSGSAAWRHRRGRGASPSLQPVYYKSNGISQVEGAPDMWLTS